MPRPRDFDEDSALEGALEVFAQRGFAGTSTGQLVEAMNIGRQSLYNTFGSKRKLYLKALTHYVRDSTGRQMAALWAAPSALEGLAAVFDVLIEDASSSAQPACLGVSAICEFGQTDTEVARINQVSGHALRNALAERIQDGQSAGQIADTVTPADAASFLVTVMIGLRIAARSGTPSADLDKTARMALSTLRS